MIKWNLSQGCKNRSIFEIQSRWYTILTNWRITHVIISIDALKKLHKVGIEGTYIPHHIDAFDCEQWKHTALLSVNLARVDWDTYDKTDLHGAFPDCCLDNGARIIRCGGHSFSIPDIIETDRLNLDPQRQPLSMFKQGIYLVSIIYIEMHCKYHKIEFLSA